MRQKNFNRPNKDICKNSLQTKKTVVSEISETTVLVAGGGLEPPTFGL